MVPTANPPTTPAATGQPPARALETPVVARVRMAAATAGIFISFFILILRIKRFLFSRIRCFRIRPFSIRGPLPPIRLNSGHLARNSAGNARLQLAIAPVESGAQKPHCPCARVRPTSFHAGPRFISRPQWHRSLPRGSGGQLRPGRCGHRDGRVHFA